MKYPSKVIEEAVSQFSSLPGIGVKTATRLVLNMLKKDASEINKFGKSILDISDNVKFCDRCHNISDIEICSICNNMSRDKSLLCIVEDFRDVFAIEHTNQFNGLYHILGGIISPMDGIGPANLNIPTLIERVNGNEIKEVIFALSTTMEGDTTAYYIFKKMIDRDIMLSTISRGVAVGGELEYVDEITLGRSITTRIPYDSSMSNS